MTVTPSFRDNGNHLISLTVKLSLPLFLDSEEVVIFQSGRRYRRGFYYFALTLLYFALCFTLRLPALCSLLFSFKNFLLTAVAGSTIRKFYLLSLQTYSEMFLSSTSFTWQPATDTYKFYRIQLTLTSAEFVIRHLCFALPFALLYFVFALCFALLFACLYFAFCLPSLCS